LSYRYFGHHQQFGTLRVINEDRVAPKTGFGPHSHEEFEIFSYIVDGELQHDDSMANKEVLVRGDVQLTSAGTGISHSEKAHGEKQVHFIQIWSKPSTSRLQPAYFTRHFADEEKKDKWARVVAPANAPNMPNEPKVSLERFGSGPAPVQSPLTLYATILSPSTSLPHTFTTPKGYIHVIQTSGYNTEAAKGATIKISGGNGVEQVLSEGDGAYISAECEQIITVQNVGDRDAEMLLFDIET